MHHDCIAVIMGVCRRCAYNGYIFFTVKALSDYKEEIGFFIFMPRKPHGFLNLGMNGHHMNEQSKRSLRSENSFVILMI